jgi:hypothetical protein
MLLKILKPIVSVLDSGTFYANHVQVYILRNGAKTNHSNLFGALYFYMLT